MKRKNDTEVEAVFDSNAAAKNNRASASIDQFMVSILQSLIVERNQAQASVQQQMQIAKNAQAKIEAYLAQCAQIKGVRLEDFVFDDRALAFVPRESK